jgi:Ras-related protein Rab-6A
MTHAHVGRAFRLSDIRPLPTAYLPPSLPPTALQDASSIIYYQSPAALRLQLQVAELSLRVALKPRHRYKVVLLGDEGVGKTSLRTEAFSTHADEEYASKTIYLEDRIVRLCVWSATGSPSCWGATCCCCCTRAERCCRCSAAPCAGRDCVRTPQSSHRLMPSWLPDASIAIVVYDVTSRSTADRHLTTATAAPVGLYPLTSAVLPPAHLASDRASFIAADQWIAATRVERGSDCLCVLVGNKTDLADRRQVSSEEAQRKAEQLQVLCCECSAMNTSCRCLRALFRALPASLP